MNKFSGFVGKSGPRGEVGVQEKLWAVETDTLGKITMMSEVSYYWIMSAF